MRSFLRIDGEELPLRGGRIIWTPARSNGELGVVFHLVSHGSGKMLHIAAWAPGRWPADISGSEITVTELGSDGAVDGRLFGVALIRFGRVSATRAIVSIDGDIEGLDPESSARSQVACDVECEVLMSEDPAYCSRCGTPLGDDSVSVAKFISGRRVTVSRRLPTCAECRERGEELAPPQRCSSCGAEYQPEGVSWTADERTLAYTCTCPYGHTVSGSESRAA
jgi:hypothetical protein